MKTIENLLLKACGYTVLILGLFYSIGALNDLGAAYISFSSFLLIALFGLLISVAGLLLKCNKIHIIIRVLIHYLVLLISFYVIFITSKNIPTDSTGKILIASVIFTVFYAIMFCFVYIIKHFIRKTDMFVDNKIEKKYAANAKKNVYKSLYKSEDGK